MYGLLRLRCAAWGGAFRVVLDGSELGFEGFGAWDSRGSKVSPLDRELFLPGCTESSDS